MGQPEFSLCEARLLECLQDKKSLTGWPRSIATIARVGQRGLGIARKKLTGYGFVSEEILTSDDGDGTHVIKLSITTKGMQVVAISDGKKSERINVDIKDLIANMGYRQADIAKELGFSKATFTRKINSELRDDERKDLIKQIRQLCQ